MNRYERSIRDSANTMIGYGLAVGDGEMTHPLVAHGRSILAALDYVLLLSAEEAMPVPAPNPGAVILSAAELAELRAHVEAAREPQEAPARLEAIKRMLSL